MTRRPFRLRHTLAAVFMAGALTLGLSACVSAEATTAELRGSVVQIAERAAAGDYAGALAALALLDKDVAAAVDAGRLDGEREQRIRAAMELVRVDLETASVAATPEPAPEPQPEPEPAPEPPADDGGDGGNEGEGGGEDNSGPGNNNGNNGNGNGNSGNNGNGNNGNGNGNDD